MKMSVASGAVLAASAAALVLTATTAPVAYAAGEKVHCYGVNSCKGTSACKTASNACKGQNECKGHGFLVMPKSECLAKGGSLTEG